MEIFEALVLWAIAVGVRKLWVDSMVSYLDKTLITCVPTRNSYEFPDVPTTVSRIALLDLSFMVRGNEFHIKIRDLAIEGK
jgi:hypothetical protein